MPQSNDAEAPRAPGAADFRTTRWSLVLAAGAPDADQASRALAELCRAYWYPVYAFVRRQGYGVEDAEDLTQGFFAHLIERETFAAARREKGRFRSFLLGALRHYLGYERRKECALKRGGGADVVPMEGLDGEERYQRELAHETTPERLYLRSWAEALLAATLEQLRGDYDKAGKRELFETLQPHLAGAANETSYQQLGAALRLSVGAVTTSMYRMRKRYGQLLREQIAHTVSSPEEVDEEIAFLFSALES